MIDLTHFQEIQSGEVFLELSQVMKQERWSQSPSAWGPICYLNNILAGCMLIEATPRHKMSQNMEY